MVVLKFWCYGVVLLDFEKRVGGKWLWKFIRKYKYISLIEFIMVEEEEVLILIEDEELEEILGYKFFV